MKLFTAISQTSVLVLAHFAHSTIAEAEQLNALHKRGETIPGWALVADECPTGTTECSTGTCCPVDAYCDYLEADSNICCPMTDPFCLDLIVSGGNKCANDGWVLFDTTLDPICCLPGEIGTEPVEGDFYGSCLSAGEALGTATRASLVGTGVTIPYTQTALVSLSQSDLFTSGDSVLTSLLGSGFASSLASLLTSEFGGSQTAAPQPGATSPTHGGTTPAPGATSATRGSAQATSTGKSGAISSHGGGDGMMAVVVLTVFGLLFM